MSLKDISPPASVPAGLTEPSRSYKRQAWIAFLALLAFFAFYLGLSAWFVATAIRLFASEQILFALPVALLAVFMLKALFFMKRGDMEGALEIKRTDEPELFGFIDRLADSVKAPRPHRVFLTAEVNAAVAYDLSLLNLILPTRKNLIIGLGLVNTLDVAQFKAVLAHEFGHFSQRSMAVGRFVHLGQQIAAHLISVRDALDGLVDGISRVDFRIAWIGWILSIIIWSIRSVTGSVFRLVVLAQLALSREMEFHADLVAVSVTGSDHLINGLHRTEAAGAAWQKTLDIVNDRAGKNRSVSDLFAVQTRVLERMREVLANPAWGATPAMPADGRSDHRVFEDDLGAPLRMWSTHPSHRDREENAKRLYIPAGEQSDSAWVLFAKPAHWRETLTRMLYASAKTKALTPQPLEETLAEVDAEFASESLAPSHKGIYHGRLLLEPVSGPESIFDPHILTSESWDFPDPAGLAESIRKLDRLNEEIAMLDAAVTLRTGELRHRGKSIRRSDIPATLATLQKEAAALRADILAQDRHRRSVHRAAAAAVGNGWEAHLVGVVRVLHYAEHSLLDLAQAARVYHETLRTMTSGSRVSADGLGAIINDANKLHRVMRRIHEQSGKLHLDSATAKRLGKPTWAEALEEFKLGYPGTEVMQSWTQVVDGWVASQTLSLQNLRRAALDELLATEARVARHHRSGTPIDVSPGTSVCPVDYPRMAPDSARKSTAEPSLWDSFMGSYKLPYTIARTAVATIILAVLLSAGNETTERARIAAIPRPPGAKIHLFNGLNTEVIVRVDNQELRLSPNRHRTLPVACTPHHLEAKTPAGAPIETFDSETCADGGDYIYNIAGAALVADYQVAYGKASMRDPRVSAKRWMRATADHIFEKPPTQIQLPSYSQGTTRTVIEASGDFSPDNLSRLAPNHDATTGILAHARFDGPEARHTLHWVYLAARLPGGATIIEDRLRLNPRDIVALRLEQDLASPETWPTVVARHRTMAALSPLDPDLRYIAIRSQRDDTPGQDEAFVAAYKDHPNHPWIRNAAAYCLARQNRLAEADTAFTALVATNGPLVDTAAIEAARVRRLRDPAKSPDLRDLAAKSPQLDYLLQFENPSPEAANQPIIRAFTALRAGDYDGAIRAAADEKSVASHLLILTAASDGAPAKLVEQALTVTPETIGSASDILCVATALAIRHNRPHEALFAQFKKVYPPSHNGLPHLLAQIRPGVAPDTIEAQAGKLELRERGVVYAFGAIVLGDAAPAAWRTRASRILFASERPRFTPKDAV